MTATDLWTTDHDPTAGVAGRFRESLVRRARKRMVEPVDADSWLVIGDPALGDQYDDYLVTIASNRYSCSCYGHAHGTHRARKICSHTLAVILWRREHRGQASTRRDEGGESDVMDRSPSTSDGTDVADSTNSTNTDSVGSGGGVLRIPVAPPPPPPPPPAVTDRRFGDPPLPAWVTEFRDIQWQAIERVLAAYERGAKVVFLQAPTGTGKSLIGDVVPRLVSTPRSGIYVATTKILQDQLARDFPYGAVLKGRSNYETQHGIVDLWGAPAQLGKIGREQSSVTCADCTKTAGSPSCRWCPEPQLCPYVLARSAAVASPLAILNTAYWLTECNKSRGLFAGREIAVIDEADLLENELMSLVEVSISPRRQRELNLHPPAKKTVEASWLDWVTNEAIPRVNKALLQLPSLTDPRAKPADIRKRKSLEELAQRLTILEAELPEGGWVYTGYDRGNIEFKPIRVDKFGHMIWDHAKRFLLMSATIVSADEMAQSLGLTEPYEVVDVPMSFPAANRPIHIGAVASMTAKSFDTTGPKMARAVANVLEHHPDERVLVHTVSYKLTDLIVAAIRMKHPERAIHTYSSAQGRDSALANYLSTEGAVLVAPSMDRGVDLPGDACRVQIITKIPFPNLGDKQVNARLHSRGGDAWYRVQTIRSLIQMTGRGVRSADDRAVTYIFDHQFTENIWKNSRQLLPKWWIEALDWRFDVRRIV